MFQIDEIVPKKFPKRIAFNLIPQIDTFMEDGYTREEWKMVVETKKILDPKIKLTATCVRVPVFIGHSEAVNIEFENPITADEAREMLRNAPGCIVIDKHEPGGYVTPYESVGEDATYISRIREDATVENGLAMWVVADNQRKGAALNAIQIAECLINRKLITAEQKAAYAARGLHARYGKRVRKDGFARIAALAGAALPSKALRRGRSSSSRVPASTRWNATAELATASTTSRINSTFLNARMERRVTR